MKNNLFLCKVLDEDKSENAQLDFQWIEGKDNFQELLKRLNDLYKSGMQKYLRDLKPTVFEDLIAMNALYRPGPLEYIPSFVNRKNGKEKEIFK